MMTMQTNKYRTLIFLIISIIIPLIISWFLYQKQSSSTLSKIDNVNTTSLNTKQLWQKESSAKWQIIQVSTENCDSDCENIAFTLSQIKKALGKNSERVNIQKVILSTQDIKEYNQSVSKNGFSIENKLYLVDPLGNLSKYYPDTSNPMNILKDLNLLLERPQVG